MNFNIISNYTNYFISRFENDQNTSSPLLCSCFTAAMACSIAYVAFSLCGRIRQVERSQAPDDIPLLSNEDIATVLGRIGRNLPPTSSNTSVHGRTEFRTPTEKHDVKTIDGIPFTDADLLNEESIRLFVSHSKVIEHFQQGFIKQNRFFEKMLYILEKLESDSSNKSNFQLRRIQWMKQEIDVRTRKIGDDVKTDLLIKPYLTFGVMPSVLFSEENIGAEAEKLQIKLFNRWLSRHYFGRYYEDSSDYEMSSLFEPHIENSFTNDSSLPAASVIEADSTNIANKRYLFQEIIQFCHKCNDPLFINIISPLLSSLTQTPETPEIFFDFCIIDNNLSESETSSTSSDSDSEKSNTENDDTITRAINESIENFLTYSAEKKENIEKIRGPLPQNDKEKEEMDSLNREFKKLLTSTSGKSNWVFEEYFSNNAVIKLFLEVTRDVKMDESLEEILNTVD